MKLYVVYHNDPECPEKVLITENKDKANLFIKRYNEVNYKPEYDEQGMEINRLTADKMYMIEIDTEEEEKKTDKLLGNYKEYSYLYIKCKDGEYFKLFPEYSFTKYKIIDEEDDDSDEYENFYLDDKGTNSYSVIIRHEKTTNMKLTEDMINRAKQIRREYSFLFRK